MSSQLENEASFEATALGFLWRQFTRPKPLPVGITLAGEVAIVTGSNIGLGLSVCRQFLELGLSCLIMGVRSQAKGDAAAAQLRRDFPNAVVLVWIVDMESYDSVRVFANRCESLDRIDIVILNAGLIKTPYTVVRATGNEVTLQVNYLSTALLTILLLPILKAKRAAGASRPSVLSLVGSDSMYENGVELRGPILPQFQREDSFSQFSWYGKSKLLQTIFVSKLADVVSPDDVLVNVSNPGMTRGTDFFRGYPAFIIRLIAIGQWVLARPVRVAATTYLDAVLVQGEKSHGSFTSDWAIKPYPKIWYTPEGRELKERLWEETMVELNFAGASKIFEFMRQLSSDSNNIVVGLVRDKASTEKAVAEELAGRSNIHVVQSDIADYEALKNAVAKTAEITGGSLDYLVANAAYISKFDAYDPIGALGDSPEELEQDLLKSFKVNVVSNIHLINLFMPLIRAGTARKVIALSTGMADLDPINKYEVQIGSGYAMSKAAMNIAIGKFHAQYKEEGILFMSICPGVVETGHYKTATPEQMEKVGGMFRKFVTSNPQFEGPATPEAAIKDVISVWEKASIEGGNGGTYVSHHGNKQWL
ncbi:hypothetical protein V8C37DRAFT_405014 [Trichoderma ceciliae]